MGEVVPMKSKKSKQTVDDKCSTDKNFYFELLRL